MLSSHIFNDSLRCQNSSLRLQGGVFSNVIFMRGKSSIIWSSISEATLKRPIYKNLNSTILPSYWLQCRYFQSFPPNRLCTGWCWDVSPPQLCVYSVYMRRRLMIVSVVSMTYCRDFLLFPTVFPNSTCQNSQRIPCRPAWLTAESDLPPHRWSHAVLFLQGFLTQLRCSDFLVLSHTKETP